ncbi:MAG: 6-carboxytetrahydropterin synthase QueD [Candidatus Kapaibacteriales bacterium]
MINKDEKPKIRLGKDFHWEMSHRLPFHNGGCQNVHGHSYKMRVDIIGHTDTNGMVLDFYEIERIVRPYLDQMDHAFTVDQKDKVIIDFLDQHGFKKYVVSENTTAENLAVYFLKEFSPLFAEFENISGLSVRVYETTDAFAEVSADLK